MEPGRCHWAKKLNSANRLLNLANGLLNRAYTLLNSAVPSSSSNKATKPLEFLDELCNVVSCGESKTCWLLLFFILLYLIRFLLVIACDFYCVISVAVCFKFSKAERFPSTYEMAAHSAHELTFHIYLHSLPCTNNVTLTIIKADMIFIECPPLCKLILRTA